MVIMIHQGKFFLEYFNKYQFKLSNNWSLDKVAQSKPMDGVEKVQIMRNMVLKPQEHTEKGSDKNQVFGYWISDVKLN